jgi:hypothetical protein
VFLAEAYLRLGRLDEARRSGADGLEMCRATGFAYGTGLGERALGEVSLAAGRLDEAATHLGRARELFAGMGSRHEVTRTTLALAALAHARGEAAQATRLLEAAREAFQALGMPALVARAEGLARSWAPHAGDAGARPSPAAAEAVKGVLGDSVSGAPEPWGARACRGGGGAATPRAPRHSRD